MRIVEVEAGYRYAFEDFSRKAQLVQALTAQQNTDERAFETALLDLEKAHLAYNQARDTFLRSLLPASAQIPAAEDQDRASDVPTLAELIWESAGRPDGTAEEDWRRAEAIVKSAIATEVCD
jgi:phosphosulfolactate phosphohydrolase-like enzyme